MPANGLVILIVDWCFSTSSNSCRNGTSLKSRTAPIDMFSIIHSFLIIACVRAVLSELTTVIINSAGT